jgi:hypothetical protein
MVFGSTSVAKGSGLSTQGAIDEGEGGGAVLDRLRPTDGSAVLGREGGGSCRCSETADGLRLL